MLTSFQEWEKDVVKINGRVMVFLVAAALMVALALGQAPAEAGEAVVHSGSGANVRSGPGTDYALVGITAKGDRLPVLETSGQWVKVRLADGKTGWVAGWLVEVRQTAQAAQPAVAPAATAPAATAQVSREAVVQKAANLRSGPGTSFAQVGSVSPGARLPVLETSGQWVKVRLADGKTGWVAGWLVEVRQTAQTAQPAVAPAATAPAATTQVSREAVVQKAANLRSGPGTSFAQVGSVSPGARLPVLETSGQWVKVRLADGKTGWVAGWLVEVSQVTQTVQPAQPAPQQSLPIPVTQVSREVVIKAGGVNVRSGPGTSHELAATLPQGTRMPLLEVSGHWLKVRLPDNKTGWVAAWLVDVKQVTTGPAPVASTPVHAVVNGSLVYLRGGPGTTHNVVSQVSRGDRLGILERSGDWYKVAATSGTIGWVAGWLVNVDQAEASTPPDNQVEVPLPEMPLPEVPPVPPANGDSGEEGVDTGPDRKDHMAIELENLSVVEDNDRTVVSVTGSHRLNANVFTLKAPDRLIIDISGAEPGDLTENMVIRTNLVTGVRVGLFSSKPAVTRLVLDLTRPVFYEKKFSADGTMLQVDVYVPRMGEHLSGKVIVLDPGHGGRDPGAIGPNGLQEKAVTLDVATRTARILRESGARVILTRETDIFVDLPDRVDISDKAGADIFVSIHINASPNREKDGTSTYFLRDSTGSHRTACDRLARLIQNELVAELGRRDLGVMQANFVVLRTSAPAALAEIAFISNYSEESLMRQDAFRSRSAEAIARAINNYFALQH